MIKAARNLCIGLAVWVLSAVQAAAVEPVLEGEMVQGGLVVGRTLPGSAVEVDGTPIRVSDEGVFLIGFGRDHPGQSRLVLTGPDGERSEQNLRVAKRKFDIQHIDGLPPSKVTPKAEDLARIRRDIALVKEARKRDDERTDFIGGWIWPVEGRISGVYGSQRILNGEPRQPHYGVDVAAPTGTLVRSPAAGLVTLVHDDMFYSGGTLIIDHGQNLSSSFLHLSEILVKEGERVRQGDPIARVGATGRVTGAHLDWRMNLRQARLDPQLLVPPMRE